MNRHNQREKAMICLYQHLLVKQTVMVSVEDVMDRSIEELDDFSRILVLETLKNKERYIEYINEVLKDWKFDRLGVLEQAILLMACSEFDHKTASAAVIIDESVRLAKSYCDEDTYKLINGVLDRL